MHQRRMKVSGEPPAKSGVYLLIHSENGVKIAFVGHCNDLRHRRAVWEYNFRAREKNPAHQMTVKMFPDIPADKWTFTWFTCEGNDFKSTEAAVRNMLALKGVQFVEKTSRNAVTLTYQGVTGKMTELCERFGVPYNKAYYLWRKGRSVEEIFAKKLSTSPEATA